MRRMRERGTPTDSGMLVSPGEIIARAAATVPERLVPDTEENPVRVWTPPRTADDTIVVPPAAPNRRARRRPKDMLRYAWFYASRGALAAAMLALVFGLPYWLLHSGAIDDAERQAAETYASWRRDASFAAAAKLDRLMVEGRNRTARDDLRAALQLKKGDSLLAADPWEIKRRLEALPWIRSAVVERRFPGTILVKLIERTPIARFQDGKRMVLVDEAGDLIQITPQKEHDNLIVLAGDGAPDSAAALLKLLEEEPALARRVATATRLGRRRWDLAFDNGAVLRLPDGYERAALLKFGEFERSHSLLARGAVTYDMRLPDRLIIRSSRAADPDSAPGAPDKPSTAKKARKTG
ncbi:MAG: FtsQ-type POTRA domain-containing protein [Rhodospirillaceae bacterium]|nr:FtsQ-type POTRA domain-containing protein [Rhodospirillaceae bacterium]